jgi:hypothetical protein
LNRFTGSGVVSKGLARSGGIRSHLRRFVRDAFRMPVSLLRFMAAEFGQPDVLLPLMDRTPGYTAEL